MVSWMFMSPGSSILDNTIRHAGCLESWTKAEVVYQTTDNAWTRTKANILWQLEDFVNELLNVAPH
jgi:hypothetical protein